MADRERSSRPGPRRLPPDVVAFDQRERLMAAMATVVYEEGYEKTTITAIVTTAAIARQTFYEHFADKDACFLATFDALVDHLKTLLVTAYGTEGPWPDRVAAAIFEGLRFFSDHPEAARVCLVDSAALGEAIRPRLDEATDWLGVMLELGREHDDVPTTELVEPIGEPVVVGMTTMLGGRIVSGQEDLVPLSGEVIESVLGPYIGYERAREVAARHRSSDPG